MIMALRDVKAQCYLGKKFPDQIHVSLRLAQIYYGIVIAVYDPAVSGQRRNRECTGRGLTYTAFGNFAPVFSLSSGRLSP